MPSAGTPCYSVAKHPVCGTGWTFSAREFYHAQKGPITKLINDEAGRSELRGLLSQLPETDFEPTVVERILRRPKKALNWRVGEAWGEAYLTKHRNCHFPWPDGRDERRANSSLPGADLVGFQKHGPDDYRFAFGEIKTSAEFKHPPGVMHGQNGLRNQIEYLRDTEDARDGLMRYLGHRAKSSAWFTKFQAAVKRYLKSSSDIALFGILVRDVSPNENDLRASVETLSETVPSPTFIELLALYFPAGSIASLGSPTIAKKGGVA